MNTFIILAKMLYINLCLFRIKIFYDKNRAKEKNALENFILFLEAVR